jgi:hypothetical protein
MLHWWALVHCDRYIWPELRVPMSWHQQDYAIIVWPFKIKLRSTLISGWLDWYHNGGSGGLVEVQCMLLGQMVCRLMKWSWDNVTLSAYILSWVWRSHMSIQATCINSSLKCTCNNHLYIAEVVNDFFLFFFFLIRFYIFLI